MSKYVNYSNFLKEFFDVHTTFEEFNKYKKITYICKEKGHIIFIKFYIYKLELSYELKLDILTDKTEDFGGGEKSPHPNKNVILIEINQYNDLDQSTWVHPRVAIHIAQLKLLLK